MLPSFQPTLSEHEVEEIFESFRAYLHKEGYFDLPPEEVADLDPLDRKIIEVVRQIEEQGLRATDDLVAKRLPVMNPNTSKPYHRVTINRRRCKLRDKCIKV